MYYAKFEFLLEIAKYIYYLIDKKYHLYDTIQHLKKNILKIHLFT